MCSKTKTIKELSEILGISKVALYKKLKTQLKHELTGHTKKVNNVTYVDDFGMAIISDSLKTKTVYPFNSSIEPEQVNSEVNYPVKNMPDISTNNEANHQVNSKLNNEVKNQFKTEINSQINSLEAFNHIINTLTNQLNEKDKQLKEKDNQLKEKDNQISINNLQIEKLHTELSEQNKHIRQQSERFVDLIEQINELQRNNQVLIAQQNIQHETLESPDTKKSKSIFSRLFHKKQNQT